MTEKKAIDKVTFREWFDEIQETLMIIGALALWGGFEYLVLTGKVTANNDSSVSITRTALISIVTNLFTYKFTKSLPPRGQ